eukprot:scaffold3256_cov114-Isochrysis_galbana.AAC.10
MGGLGRNCVLTPPWEQLSPLGSDPGRPGGAHQLGSVCFHLLPRGAASSVFKFARKRGGGTVCTASLCVVPGCVRDTR